jgi:hypothetical protein
MIAIDVIYFLFKYNSGTGKIMRSSGKNKNKQGSQKK